MRNKIYKCFNFADDTAVPKLHDSSDISMKDPEMEPTNHSYSNIHEALNYPSTEKVQTADRQSEASSINQPPSDTALLEDHQTTDVV